MFAKPTLTPILLTIFSILHHSHALPGLIGAGCPDQNAPCSGIVDEARVNAIYSPSGYLIGGCNCVSIDCLYPRAYNADTKKCECHNKPEYGCLDMTPRRIFNQETCSCECEALHIAGSDLRECIINTAPNYKILPDCSCLCPLSVCPVGKVVNPYRCECECPVCPPGQVVLDGNTCQCSVAGGPIVIHPQPQPSVPAQPQPTVGQPQPQPQPQPGVTQPQTQTPITIATTAAPVPVGPVSNYCCQTIMATFTPYFGKCWGLTDAMECNGRTSSQGSSICRWDVNNCHPGKPTCAFTDDACAAHTDCCSYICKSDATCL